MVCKAAAEIEIRIAGYDLIAMKKDGFKYDPEIDASPVKQAEMFCESLMCAANNY